MAIESNHLQTVADQDGAAILDIEHGTITTLNPTGAFVWRRLGRNEHLETIIADLVSETGEDNSTIERDVYEFVASLKQRRLLP